MLAASSDVLMITNQECSRCFHFYFGLSNYGVHYLIREMLAALC